MAFQGGRRLVVVFLKDCTFNHLMKTGPIFKSYLHTYNLLTFDNGSPDFYKKLMSYLPQKEIVEPNEV